MDARLHRYAVVWFRESPSRLLDVYMERTEETEGLPDQVVYHGSAFDLLGRFICNVRTCVPHMPRYYHECGGLPVDWQIE